jgi:hypothetical protein
MYVYIHIFIYSGSRSRERSRENIMEQLQLTKPPVLVHSDSPGNYTGRSTSSENNYSPKRRSSNSLSPRFHFFNNTDVIVNDPIGEDIHGQKKDYEKLRYDHMVSLSYMFTYTYMHMFKLPLVVPYIPYPSSPYPRPFSSLSVIVQHPFQ